MLAERRPAAGFIPCFTPLDRRIARVLVDMRTFGSGAVYLRYARR